MASTTINLYIYEITTKGTKLEELGYFIEKETNINKIITLISTTFFEINDYRNFIWACSLLGLLFDSRKGKKIKE